jgi:2',3'-cyclic-nucleotide 2'-phosphodiesterase (5'-nucleotidase family)
MVPSKLLVGAALILTSLAHGGTDGIFSKLGDLLSLQPAPQPDGRTLHTDNTKDYTVRVYHINDMHVHLDEMNSHGSHCDKEKGEMCYGGASRLKQYLLDHRPRNRPSMLVNAGDETTGTMFYRAFGHQKIAETMNQLNYTAMALGNHEFDAGVPGLRRFLDMLDFPVLSTNSHLPARSCPDTCPPEKLERYRIFEEYDMAVVGVTTDSTAFQSKGGSQATFDEVIRAVQDAINEIRTKTRIRRIMLLSHIGYDVDQRVARETSGLYYIVGGHTDTLLGSMPSAEGPYPTIVKNKEDKDVYIVQDFHWGIYLGAHDVTFRPDGTVKSLVGKPILMSEDLPQEPSLQMQVGRWRQSFQHWAESVIGHNKFENNVKSPHCKEFPCFAGALSAEYVRNPVSGLARW